VSNFFFLASRLDITSSMEFFSESPFSSLVAPSFKIISVFLVFASWSGSAIATFVAAAVRFPSPFFFRAITPVRGLMSPRDLSPLFPIMTPNPPFFQICALDPRWTPTDLTVFAIRSSAECDSHAFSFSMIFFSQSFAFDGSQPYGDVRPPPFPNPPCSPFFNELQPPRVRVSLIKTASLMLQF